MKKRASSTNESIIRTQTEYQKKKEAKTYSKRLHEEQITPLGLRCRDSNRKKTEKLVQITTAENVIATHRELNGSRVTVEKTGGRSSRRKQKRRKKV